MKFFPVSALICLFSFSLAVAAQNNPALDEAEAAALARAGRTDQAVQVYERLLRQEPDNVSALAEISGTLERAGRWREAVPYLEHLIRLEPGNLDAIYRLGQMKSWQSSEQNHEAETLLKRACAGSDHDPQYCEPYADILSWKQASRAQAVDELRAMLRLHPQAASARVKLGQILSWNNATRPEALQIFDAGLKLDPRNVDLLLASAEVLSWRRSTWTEAISRYDHVLELQPEDARALNGKAQLLVWMNHSAEGNALYRQVLEHDPKNPAALRGEAEIMNRRGLFVEARSLAEQAHVGAPEDERAALELARANIGLQKFSAARDALSVVNGTPSTDFLEARQDIRRGLGTYMEVGYGLRKANGNADFNRFDVALSSPLGGSSRLTFLYQPTLYQTPQQNFNTSYFEASLNSQVTDRLTTHFQAGAEVFQNAPVAVDGGFNMRFKPISSTTLNIGFTREPIVESLLSTRGQDVGANFFGQVRSNLGNLGVSYYNSAHKYDLSLDYSDGLYTGHNLANNRRYEVDANVGKAVRMDKPYIRLGFGTSFISFDHDADLNGGQPITPLTGGYFSPTRFLLNQGVLTFAHNFSRNVEWGANGTAGVQNTETSSQSFTNTQFASSFGTHLFWRMSPMNELRLEYQYLNTFNAFERNLYRFQWRHYF